MRRPGEYICSIKFADEHIPFSPFRIFVTDPKEGGRTEAYEVPIQFATKDRVTRERETIQVVSMNIPPQCDKIHINTSKCSL